jgi:hypothetical protein
MVGNGYAGAGPSQSLRSGRYGSSGLLWRPEWRGGIVYHIFICIYALFPGFGPASGWWCYDPYLGPSVDVDGTRECCLGVDENVVHK